MADSATGELDALGAVAHAALPRFGLDPATRVALIHRRENAVFRLDPPGGEPWALRVHRLGYRTRDEIRSELAWMAALRDAGVRTPPARTGADGEDVQSVRVPGLEAPRDVTVLGWIDGPALDPEAASAEAFRLVGRTSALIQRQARGWTPPPWFTRPTWHVDALIGPTALWGDYADLAPLEPEQLALLHRVAAVVRRRLAAFGDGPDRFGLTHGDLMPDNILLEHGTPVVIDFDDAGYGWYVYDLATLLALQVGDDGAYGAIRDAWVAGYREVAPLPAAHLTELDTLVMARLLLGLGWMHTRRETALAQGVTGLAIALGCLHAERLLAREDDR